MDAMNKIIKPPLKYQGIKTKLVPFIEDVVQLKKDELWIEPFMGSGVVGFNMSPEQAVMSDLNEHVIHFYKTIANKENEPEYVKEFLETQGKLLSEYGEKYYYVVRERFNDQYEPLDLLFLSYSCFNGIMRFNQKGGYNVPFCKNINRFSKTFINKIVKQYKDVYNLLNENWMFINGDYQEIIEHFADDNSIIYCDPPYIGRNNNYIDSWTEKNEKILYELLNKTNARFVLSTWVEAKGKQNECIEKYWKDFNIYTKDHFYNVGPKTENRYAVTEALITNF